MDSVFPAYCVLRTAHFLRPYLARLYAILSPKDPISARSGFGRTQGSPLRWILSFLRTVYCGLRTSYALISPAFMRFCLRRTLSRLVRDSGGHKVRPYDGFCLSCALCTADCALPTPLSRPPLCDSVSEGPYLGSFGIRANTRFAPTMDSVFPAYCVLRTAPFLRPYLARLYAILSPKDPISARSGFGRTQGSPLRCILSFLRTVYCGLRTSYALISPAFMRFCLPRTLSRLVRDSGEHKVRPYDGFCLSCALCTADCALSSIQQYPCLRQQSHVPVRH
jgi:hypothetical protein